MAILNQSSLNSGRIGTATPTKPAEIASARAGSTVPMAMQVPKQLNANAMNNQVQSLQGQNMATPQAVNKAAQNTNNMFAKGGTNPTKAEEAAIKAKYNKEHERDEIKDVGVDELVKLLADTNALKPYTDKTAVTPMPTPQRKPSMGDKTVKIPPKPSSTPSGATGAGGLDPNEYFGYAKGGNVKGATEAKKPGTGILNMNDDGAYASGGQVQADSVTGYNPDGTPIVQNADGTQDTGSINSLLGRPDNAPTRGLGVAPTSTNTFAEGGTPPTPPGSNTAEVSDEIPAKLSEGEFVLSADVVRFYGLNSINQMVEHARNALMEMNEEGTIRAPGDAGEQQPEHEAMESPEYEAAEESNAFLQDQPPSGNVYDYNAMESEGVEDEEGADKLKGLLGRACGGEAKMSTGGLPGKAQTVKMFTGGGLGEEQSLNKGGIIGDKYRKEEYPVGRTHQVSSKPTVDAAPMDGYAKGGSVKSKGGLLAKDTNTYNRDINTRQALVGK